MREYQHEIWAIAGKVTALNCLDNNKNKENISMNDVESLTEIDIICIPHDG